MNPPKTNWPGGPPHSTKRYNSQDFKRLCSIDEILTNFITPKATPQKKKQTKKRKGKNLSCIITPHKLKHAIKKMC
jgi:hypothetical protein